AWLNPEPGDLASQYRILDDREEIRYVLDAWLNPEPGDLASQYRILDDREEIRYVFEESA
ncbi:hypothetical protein Q2B95_18180, partial [Stenotrophomonas maltophilia]